MSCPDPKNPQDIAVSDSEDGLRELEIDGLAAGGRGVARVDGMVWFVPGALPGDRVVVREERRHTSYVEGRLVRRLRDAPERREAPCPLHGRCGGCPWMGLDERAQQDWKRRMVVEALARIGRCSVEVAPLRAPRTTLGYRNKVEFTLGVDAAGRPSVALHGEADSATRGALVDVARCPIQNDLGNAVLTGARSFLLERPRGWVEASEGLGEPYRLILRTSQLRGEALVAVRETSRPFPEAEELAAALMADQPAIVGVVRIRAREGRRGGARVATVAGRDWIEERVGGTAFRLPAASFLQVHMEAAEILAELVRDGVGPVKGQSAVDLYGGVGLFGIDLARRGARVTICETDLDAVRCGRRAVRGAGIGEVDFRHVHVAAFLREARTSGRRIDLVVANPPRSGLGRRVPEGIAALAPRRVVVVSCDPATLARDARRLEQAGFVAERAVPVDVFPQTAHVETVMTFSPA